MQTSIRARLLAVFLVIAVTAAGVLSVYALGELEGYALRKLEQRLESEARVLAALIASVYEEAGSRGAAAHLLAQEPARRVVSRALTAVGPQVLTRLRVVDASGTVVVDSAEASPAQDLRASAEVRAALAGRYGAATRMTADRRVALYVAVPVVVGGRVVGATLASSTTFSIATLIRAYRARVGWLIVAYIVIAVVVTELLARWLARPLDALEKDVAAFAAGDHTVRAVPSGARETRSLAAGFNLLADEIERMVAGLRAEEERKSRFVSDVSHELRTPLTAIRGTAETLMHDDLPARDRERFLMNIVSESDRLARLANDLMTLERIEGGRGELVLQPVELESVMSRAKEALAPLLVERRVDVRVAGTAPPVLGDPDRLMQVASNLLDNASRMSPPHGRIDVELSSEGPSAVLTLGDRGSGIPQEDLPNVFDRFYRSESSRSRSSGGGAGLGLAIAKAIVIAHRGSIEVANRDGGGALFTVRIPSLSVT